MAGRRRLLIAARDALSHDFSWHRLLRLPANGHFYFVATMFKSFGGSEDEAGMALRMYLIRHVVAIDYSIYVTRIVLLVSTTHLNLSHVVNFEAFITMILHLKLIGVLDMPRCNLVFPIEILTAIVMYRLKVSGLPSQASSLTHVIFNLLPALSLGHYLLLLHHVLSTNKYDTFPY